MKGCGVVELRRYSVQGSNGGKISTLCTPGLLVPTDSVSRGATGDGVLSWAGRDQ